MNSEGLSLNVIILPDENTSLRARNLAKVLGEKYENYYTLYDQKYVPHATIYQAQYPQKNLDSVKDALGNLAAGTKSFQVQIAEYEVHHTYVWWNFAPNQYLSELHRLTLNKLNPLREGLFLPHLTPIGYATGEKFTEDEAENVRKYGAVVVDKLFKPHITLARLKVEPSTKILYELLPKTETTFQVSEICLGRMGDHGTVIEITDRFKFS